MDTEKKYVDAEMFVRQIEDMIWSAGDRYEFIRGLRASISVIERMEKEIDIRKENRCQ